ncbi:Protein M3 [Rhodotorula kratochvilovae]
MSVNALIWISIKPLLKLAIPTAIGVWLTRAGLFPIPAARGASQIILNVTLPALLFSKITPSINHDNAQAIGPIFLVAIVYLIISLLMGVIVRLVFPTPRNFRWGLLAAATWSNWGDLPTSVVQTVCASAPFSGAEDADLAVAYVAIFILVFYITLFPARGIHLIERDYTHPPRELSREEQEEQAARGPLDNLRGIGRNVSGLVRRRRGGRVDASSEEERGALPKEAVEEKPAAPTHFPQATFSPLHRQTTSRSIDAASVREIAGAAHAASPSDVPGRFAGASATPASELLRSTSLGRRQLRGVIAAEQRLRTIAGSRATSTAGDYDEEITEVGTQPPDELDRLERKEVGLAPTLSSSALEEKREEPEERDAQLASSSVHEEEVVERERPVWQRVLVSVKEFALSLLTPPTISLVTALICALVNPLKALFVPVDDYGWHPTAPDGDPPLAILLDTAAFIGNASVPLGLLVLGSTLGRMRIPRPISKLPLYSICALALCKVVLLPIIGYVFVRGLAQHTNLVSQDNHVLQFVMIFFSVVPTATTQCALTVIFAPEDGESNADILASYLIAQYAIFVFSSVILTALTLRNIF